MYIDIHNKKYEKEWEDSLSVAIYATDYAMEKGMPLSSNMNASKKKLVKLIADMENIPSLMVFLMDNIIGLKKIIVLKSPSETIIEFDDYKISIYSSENLCDFIEILCK